MATVTTNGKAKGMTRTALYDALAEATGLTRQEVRGVIEALPGVIEREIKKGSGIFTLPRILKILKVRKPATKARKGVPNPFKPGETMDVKAKAASIGIKLRALKGLKEMVS